MRLSLGRVPRRGHRQPLCPRRLLGLRLGHVHLVEVCPPGAAVRDVRQPPEGGYLCLPLTAKGASGPDSPLAPLGGPDGGGHGPALGDLKDLAVACRRSSRSRWPTSACARPSLPVHPRPADRPVQPPLHGRRPYSRWPRGPAPHAGGHRHVRHRPLQAVQRRLRPRRRRRGSGGGPALELATARRGHRVPLRRRRVHSRPARLHFGRGCPEPGRPTPRRLRDLRVPSADKPSR